MYTSTSTSTSISISSIYIPFNGALQVLFHSQDSKRTLVREPMMLGPPSRLDVHLQLEVLGRIWEVVHSGLGGGEMPRELRMAELRNIA